MKNTMINRAAHSLVNNGKIKTRIGELLDEGRKYYNIRSVSDAALQAPN